MTNKVFIINGTGGSGKSTFVKFCAEFNDNICEISTVDFVKEVARYVGWNGEKDENGRLFLSNLKDAMEQYNNIPNRKIQETIAANPDYIYFINAREPKNIDCFKQIYNAAAILVVNPNVKPITSNHADANVFDYNYDYYIMNNMGLSNLKDMAEIFVKEVVNK